MGKKYTDSAKLIEKNRLYDPSEALGLVRNSGSSLDATSLLDKNSCRGSLCDECEGTVSVNCDNNRDNKTHIVLCALIEFLGEGHNVNTVLTECRTYRGSRSGLACGDL